MKFSWGAFREIMVIVIGIAIVVMLMDLSNGQKDGVIRGYRNRAESCRLQLGLGMPLNQNCLDPALKGYFNPHEKVNTASVRVLCDLAQQMNTIQLPPKCEEKS